MIWRTVSRGVACRRRPGTTSTTLASITPQTGSFGANLGKTAIQNVASATINSALTGASLEDSIQTALMGALVGTAAGQTAVSVQPTHLAE